MDEATGVKKNEQKLVVSAASRPNPAVASWNKRVRGGESCQLEQKGKGWRKLSAGTKG